MAGTETTSSTLSFVIFYLIKYPEVQTKIHVELDRVVGHNQIPTVELRDRWVRFELISISVCIPPRLYIQ